MNELAKGLSAEAMHALGAYFAAKPAQSHRVRDQGLAAVGAYLCAKGNQWSDVPACASCHGEDGAGSDNLPRLAGQHRHYLLQQMKAFKDRARTNDNAVMFTIQASLTEMEREALALHLSGLGRKE